VTSIRVFALATIAVVVTEALSWGISLVWFRERPFKHLKFEPLTWMPPDWKSFPSDHAAISFAIAFVYLLSGNPLGWPFLAMAALVGMSRIASGVHYPSDIAAGLLLAAVVSSLTELFAQNLPLV
jgi:undecaprenyl-diphosphatase